jgi:hypothetical protein
VKDKEKILDKIRKCMALGDSGNEHEAAAGLRQARKLMDKYGLTEAHAKLSEMKEGVMESDHARPPLWAVSLHASVARAFQCSAYGSRYSVSFVGRSDNVEVAVYVMEVLMRQIKIARKDFISNNINPKIRAARKKKLSQAYCEGWVMAVADKVKEFAAPVSNEEESKHEQFMAEIKDYEIKKSGKRKSAAESDVAAMSAAMYGAKDGKNVQLHHGVGGADEVNGIEYQGAL